MAVPWQTDMASCRSGYQKSYAPCVPTFWPARVPNQVMSRQAYDTVMNPELPIDTRLAAFARGASWLRPLGNTSYEAMLERPAGPGWLAAGDAAISFDPLSSQGIFNALCTGLAAAEAADRMLGGDAAAEGYRQELAAIGAAYQRRLAYC